MRKSYSEKGWMLDDAGKLVGICLGFDFCAEHEEGVPQIKGAFGIPSPEFPLGIADRQIQRLPAHLTFHKFEAKPRDKRLKAVPAAALLLDTPFCLSQYPQLLQRLSTYPLVFESFPGDRWYDPETDDMVCAWDRESFGILVRGDENIERLETLYKAFQDMDICLAQPGGLSFMRRGLGFAILSAVSEQEKKSILEQDEAHKRLFDAVKASGIHETLKAADKGFYALKPDWYDHDKEEGLMFFLNPRDQQNCNHGWYTVAELQEWAENRGPVLHDAALEAFGKQHRDWEFNLVKGLGEAGLYLRHHARLEWMDDAHTKVGIYLRPAVRCQDRLSEGLYDFEELTAKYAPKKETATV